MTIPMQAPFFIIQPQTAWFTVVPGTPGAVPPAPPKITDPWLKGPEAMPKIGPPSREWIVPEPPKADPPKGDPKFGPSAPSPEAISFIKHELVPLWKHGNGSTITYAVPAPLAPAWNALRCLVDLREEKPAAGNRALSNTVRFALTSMQEEYTAEKRKKETAAKG